MQLPGELSKIGHQFHLLILELLDLLLTGLKQTAQVTSANSTSHSNIIKQAIYTSPQKQLFFLSDCILIMDNSELNVLNLLLIFPYLQYFTYHAQQIDLTSVKILIPLLVQWARHVKNTLIGSQVGINE